MGWQKLKYKRDGEIKSFFFPHYESLFLILVPTPFSHVHFLPSQRERERESEKEREEREKRKERESWRNVIMDVEEREKKMR